MAKIIEFPGNWQTRGQARPAAPLPAIDGPQSLEYSRWWRLGRDILRCSAGSGLRLSPAGGLPDELARRLHQAHIKPDHDDTSRSIGSEPDSPDLVLVHGMLLDLELLREKKGWLTVTRHGQSLVDDPSGLFGLIFEQTMSRLDWKRPGLGGLAGDCSYQDLAPASLLLLSGQCNNWVSAGSVMDEAAHQLALPTTDSMALDWYRITLHAHFEPLGLVLIRCLRQDLGLICRCCLHRPGVAIERLVGCPEEEHVVPGDRKGDTVIGER